MSKIRAYAKSVDHEIIGKLTRMPEWEYDLDENMNKHPSKYRWYIDEAGNEYCVGKLGVAIVTAEGAII